MEFDQVFFVKDKTEKSNKKKEADPNCTSKSVYKKPTLDKKREIKRKSDRKYLNKSVGKKKDVLEKVKKITKGLIYISETDAEIFPFIGTFSESVSAENLLKQIGGDRKTFVEEINFEDFFRHPIKIQDWFSEERTETAKQYLLLKKLLEENLKDIKVFKVGRINLDIYIVGLDSENNLVGVKTKATET